MADGGILSLLVDIRASDARILSLLIDILPSDVGIRSLLTGILPSDADILSLLVDPPRKEPAFLRFLLGFGPMARERLPKWVPILLVPLTLAALVVAELLLVRR